MVSYRVKINGFKSREKKYLSCLDFKKTDIFYLTKFLDSFLGRIPCIGSLGRALGVISDGCMIGLGKPNVHQSDIRR